MNINYLKTMMVLFIALTTRELISNIILQPVSGGTTTVGPQEVYDTSAAQIAAYYANYVFQPGFVLFLSPQFVPAGGNISDFSYQVTVTPPDNENFQWEIGGLTGNTFVPNPQAVVSSSAYIPALNSETTALIHTNLANILQDYRNKNIKGTITLTSMFNYGSYYGPFFNNYEAFISSGLQSTLSFSDFNNMQEIITIQKTDAYTFSATRSFNDKTSVSTTISLTSEQQSQCSQRGNPCTVNLSLTILPRNKNSLDGKSIGFNVLGIETLPTTEAPCSGTGLGTICR